MNTPRIAFLSAAFVAVGLAAGCAANRADRAMHMQEPMKPVAAAPIVQQPEPVTTAMPTPMPMATGAPVMTTTPSTVVASSSNANMSDNMMTERAPRADRN